MLAETLAHDVTQLLQAWSEGDQGALDKLMPLVYRELHRQAQGYMAMLWSERLLPNCQRASVE